MHGHPSPCHSNTTCLLLIRIYAPEKERFITPRQNSYFPFSRITQHPSLSLFGGSFFSLVILYSLNLTHIQHSNIEIIHVVLFYSAVLTRNGSDACSFISINSSCTLSLRVRYRQNGCILHIVEWLSNLSSSSSNDIFVAVFVQLEV